MMTINLMSSPQLLLESTTNCVESTPMCDENRARDIVQHRQLSAPGAYLVLSPSHKVSPLRRVIFKLKSYVLDEIILCAV